MASEQSLSGLLTKLQSSVDSSARALPSESDVQPPENGISLLDTKSDLFLSYLQNLVFLILVKLRKHKHKIANQDADTPNDTLESLDTVDAAAVQKLVELRLYLEKGVRPLEGRLKYQIDKVLRAADTAAQAPRSKQPKSTSKKPKSSKAKQPSDSASASASDNSSDSDTSDDDDDTSDSASAASEIDELSYRPNPAALARATAPSKRGSRAADTDDKPADGIYRAPKITPTAPTLADPDARSNSRRAPKPLRSAAVDDYIAAELDGGPAAEASIGSTIAAGGRSTTSARERAREAERRAFEEANFTRLPRESKKERARERARAGGAATGTMGVFELGALGAMGDRVARATAKRGKRGRDTADGLRGEGTGAGYRELKKNKKRRM